MPETDIRTPKGKRHFIRTLCDRLRDVIIERIPDMPEDWDGMELRQYLADMAANETTGPVQATMLTRYGRGLREYRSTIAKAPTL